MLQIRLLGQFDIRLNGKRITISSRAGQSLLAYLALTAGTSHRREKLAGTFWPDTSDEAARKNLRQELWRIRKAISTYKKNGKEHLLADDFAIGFNRDSEYWLDAAQLERPDLDLESLTANLSLYQGELLPGFYDEWIIIERERLQSIFDTKMGQLLEQLITSERWTAVQEQSERWLSTGNSIEPAYRGLMLSYGARGDMAKVSTVYQRCIAELDEQFGLEPSAETRALYDGLLKGTQVAAHNPQPSGTITFLFTDIEGSTNLLDELKEQYAKVLADHHMIMRNAIQKWNGREVDTQGDAFFATFARALDAVQCAAEIQREIASHKWIHKSPLRVRMGLHTGEPLLSSTTGYMGMDVHRAARIGDTAHGGQVLLTQTTRELIINDLPEGITILDLGEHRLKDMKFPASIHQLVIDDLPSEFPPLRTKFSGSEAPTPGEPPFKGLQYFDEADSELFFGRELLTEKLINRLNETKFLSVVIGASGSGKSSLVRAGLIPALKNGKEFTDGTKPPTGSSDWLVHIITPTAHPLEALAVELTHDSESMTAAATLMDDLLEDPRSLWLFLARKYPQEHVLLVLDQFEELFTLCRDEFEREAFIDNLLTTLHQENTQVTLIITLRADFYAHLAQYPELRDAVAKQQEYIGPMTLEELRKAIEEPAKRGKWEFEPGLVDLILRDVGDEPGALPLLSHALLETWKRRAGHTMTLKGYADAGGVRGAIAHTAESVYQDLSDDEKIIARDIFLRLTELGEGTEDTRRRVSFDELMSNVEDTDEVRSVLNMLADARLVSLGEDTAEVAHEALIREWPTLREWLNQDREGLQLHRRLTETIHDWELLERDDGVLYRGAQLAQAREWATLHPKALNATERAFLDASNGFEQKKIADREAQQKRELEAAQKLAETERRSATRLRLRNRVITVVGVIAIVLALLALRIQLMAQADERIARARELAAASLNNAADDPELSILLALESVSATRDEDKIVLPESLEAMHFAIASSPIRMTLNHGGEEGLLTDIVYSPDGKQLASLGKNRTLVIWDAFSGEELHRIQNFSGRSYWMGADRLVYGADGKWLASFDEDMIIFDPNSGKPPRTIEVFNNESVMSIAVSPDGRYLAIGGYGGSLKLWDGVSGEFLGRMRGHRQLITSLVFSPDGKWLISWSTDQTLKIWSIPTGELLQEFPTLPANTINMNFSPDGDRFIYHLVDDFQSSIDTGSSHVFQITPQIREDPSKLFSQELFVLPKAGFANIFSPDGTMIAGVAGGAIHIWDSFSGKHIAVLSGGTGNVSKLAFSPNGKWLASADSSKGLIKIWSLLPNYERDAWDVDGKFIDYHPSGDEFATTRSDLTKVTVWDAQTGNEKITIKVDGEVSTEPVYSPDGSLLAIGQTSGKISFWDTNSGEQLRSFFAYKDNYTDIAVFELAFSPDGRYLASIGAHDLSNAKLWNVKTGELVFYRHAEWGMNDVAFSPDGNQLVTAATGFVSVWDISSRKLVYAITNIEAAIYYIDYSPDGSMIAGAGNDGIIRLWSAKDGSEIRRLTGNEVQSNAIEFSPDSKFLAADSGADRITLYDVETGQVKLVFPGFDGVGNVTFTTGDNGGNLVVSYLDGTVRVFILDTDELLALAKTRVTRSFTESECQRYLHVEQCPE